MLLWVFPLLQRASQDWIKSSIRPGFFCSTKTKWCVKTVAWRKYCHKDFQERKEKISWRTVRKKLFPQNSGKSPKCCEIQPCQVSARWCKRPPSTQPHPWWSGFAPEEEFCSNFSSPFEFTSTSRQDRTRRRPRRWQRHASRGFMRLLIVRYWPYAPCFQITISSSPCQKFFSPISAICIEIL